MNQPLSGHRSLKADFAQIRHRTASSQRRTAYGQFLRPDPGLLLEDRRNRRLARRPSHRKAIVLAELKPDQEMMVAEASYPCVERGHRDVWRAGRKFSRHTIRQVENFAKRIDSRSGDPNMHVISTQGERVLTSKPLHDRVVVRRIDEEARTAGVIIPDTAKEKPMQGEILAVGPGSGKRIQPDVKEGDTLLFGKWSGTEVKIDGEELLIMKESDIMGLVEGKSAASKAA